MATYFDDPVDVVDFIYNYLTEKSGDIGLEYVGYVEERLIPEYPAITLGSTNATRRIHGTHTFEVTFLIEMWVYHAAISDSHRVRTRDDLLLVGRVRKAMHDNLRLYNDNHEAQCIFSYISSEDPAFMRREKGPAVVGSRIELTVESQSRFK
jgi:hypothetical protein